MTEGSFRSSSQLYLIKGNDMSVLVVVKWPEMICAGRTEVRKMTACRFCIARVGSFSLLFLATAGFFGGGSRMSSVPGYEEDPVRVVTWSVMTWIDRMEAEKRAD